MPQGFYNEDRSYRVSVVYTSPINSIDDPIRGVDLDMAHTDQEWH